MSNPQIVSRDQWLAARKDLLAKEKQFTRERDALNAERRRLPMVEIDKNYVFEGPDGKASLLAWRDWSGEQPGTSVFLRDGDRIFHTYSSYARGGDLLIGTYNYLDLTPLGRQEDWEEPPGRSNTSMMAWVDYHDEYDRTPAK